MRTALISIFLLIGFSSSAQEDVHGVVMNLLGKPIKGAVISISGEEDFIHSGETGDFLLKYDAEKMSFGFVILRHPLYSDMRISLQEFQGSNGRLSVMLDAKRKNCRYVIQ
jgi:hypothetical protein